MSGPMQRVPDFVIERWHLGELTPAEAQAVRAALGEGADARGRELDADDAALLERLPPGAFATRVRRRAEAGSPAPRAAWRWWPALGLAAAALLAWWWLRVPTPAEPDAPRLAVNGPRAADGGGVDPGEEVRIKGDAVLTIDRLGASGPERLRSGDRVRVGDRLQLQYRAGDREQGAIVSVDGRGVATLHFPAAASASPALQGGGLVALDHSYELDDAPAFERFFFVTTVPGVTLDVGVVLHAAERLAASPSAARDPLPLPAGYTYSATLLDKR